MDDPKSRQTAAPAAAAPAPQFITLTPEQFAALTATKQDSDEFLQKKAKYDAEAMERQQNPSNKTHPGISVFSLPGGERDFPKPKLKCQIFWVGYEETADTLTPTEIDLMNRLEPGEYSFERTDGSPDTLSVEGQRNAGGKLTQMLIMFKCRGEYRMTVPAKVTMLRKALGLEQSESDLRAEVERLKALVGAR